MNHGLTVIRNGNEPRRAFMDRSESIAFGLLPKMGGSWWSQCIWVDGRMKGRSFIVR